MFVLVTLLQVLINQFEVVCPPISLCRQRNKMEGKCGTAFSVVLLQLCKPY